MQWMIDTVIGTVLGFLAGIGTGGGSLLLLWLTLVRGSAQEDARTVNLLFFLPGALIATALREKKTRPTYTALLPAIAVGCIAAVAASLLGRDLDAQLLKKMFGTILIAAGVREILYRDRK